MDTNFVEQLKQDVAKWEEAAKAIEELIPKMPQTDQADWNERAKRYKANGREIRNLIETLNKAR